MEVLNLALMREPLNWVIVFLMLVIGVYAIHLLWRLGGNLPSPSL